LTNPLFQTELSWAHENSYMQLLVGLLTKFSTESDRELQSQVFQSMIVLVDGFDDGKHYLRDNQATRAIAGVLKNASKDDALQREGRTIIQVIN
jgi:hypothetical protein